MPLKAPPHEVLDQFVDAKDEREGGEEEVVAAATDVPAGVHADRRHADAGDQVRLRGEAHAPIFTRCLPSAAKGATASAGSSSGIPAHGHRGVALQQRATMTAPPAGSLLCAVGDPPFEQVDVFCAPRPIARHGPRS